jgi:ATPase complex subunit ATP10
MHNPPRPGDNMGLDRRSLAKKREDFVDYDKHLEKRAQMRKEISKPYFRDWSNLRFHKGKMFTSNEKLFRGEFSLWFPNFFGKTLFKETVRRGKDGYGGLGRDTCTAMEGKVSVVSILSNQWTQGQVDTFVSAKHNPELEKVLESSKDVAQRIYIQHEPNTLRWWLIQFFRGNLRRGKSMEEQKRYFMVRRGVTEEIKESIGLLNESVGYVYLVDQECRIRWAGNAIAEPAERESMVRGVKKLIEEVRSSPKRSSKAEKQTAGPRMPMPERPKST